VIRTVIVDDEPLALEGLRILLAREPDLDLVAAVTTEDEAVEAILEHRPDLVFLDIQLEGGDGFRVVARVVKEHFPVVVFVTAHDEHALRAFDAFAIDYVLKPVDPDRLRVAIGRVRLALRSRHDLGRDRLGSLLAALDGRPLRETLAMPGFVSRFTVRTGNRYQVIGAEEVVRITSAGNYVTLHTTRGRHLLRGTLAGLERRLDPGRFARIHRTCIVNVDRVRELGDAGHGRHWIELEDGSRLMLGRSFRRHLGRWWG
jgi:two-component system, LytTR family, response regulator